ncbi:MAG TPA: DNA-3-methyladenine glycosylase [Chryseosolibacter sp.]|nr:DNA-3-methyladenine glycosylase [Chryseosolibacter sp.]
MASRLLLQLPREFDYHLNLEFLRRSPRELLHTVENDHVLKVVKHLDEKILLRIRPSETKLIVEFLNGIPSARAKEFVKGYVKEWFDMETDLSAFYKLAAADKLLGPLVDRYFGYRIIGQPDLFESIIWAVIGQQINLSFAYTLKSRFVEQFGERLHWNNESYYLFPAPKLVATLRDEHLLPLQFSRQKSKYTTLIAEAFANGILSKEKLHSLSFDEAKNELMKIKGIGNWTANYALMKTFRHPNAFPLEDAGVHNAIKNLKKMDRKPTLEEVKRQFKKYKGWEAYATLYLWKSL